MKSIVIIIDYFGKLPEWFHLYLESCRHNPTIDWLIHTDDRTQYDLPPNVTLEYMSWDEYKDMIRTKLGITFWPRNTYKICDLKPTYGFLYKDKIHEYDFFGFGDIDLVYGDIRHFYTDQILSDYDILSVHGWGLSGPLCLLKNEPWAVNAFARIPGWKDFFSIIDCVRFDEDFFWRAFTGPDGDYYGRIYLKEQYITPLVHGLWEDSDQVTHDDTWYWKDGIVTSPKNHDRQFICMHFMNYVSARYMDPRYGTVAPWCNIVSLVNVSADQAQFGFSIGLRGFNIL